MRLLAIALGLAAAAAQAVPATAQQYLGGSQGVYIDGRTPIDSRTESLVDAYVIYQEQLDQEEAERRQLQQLHIYHDRAYGTYPHGRF